MISHPPTTQDGQRRSGSVAVADGSRRKRYLFSFSRLFAKASDKRTKFLMSAFFLIVVLVGACNAEEYANQWAVEIEGGDAAADAVARYSGFANFGKLFEHRNIYMFHHHSVMKRSLRMSDEHNSKLTSHEAVISAEQQIIRRRVKRDKPDFNFKTGPDDPLWSKTWYLLPQTRPSMRVYEAWEAGYTGKGVVVTILDDGIEYTHPDLADNYDKLASKDINAGDDDPAPRPTYSNENRHGTRCAGEVAAVADNNYCSVGIAYQASIGGVRMLDGQVTDMVEGASIGLNPKHIDIYSASWGPDDDGRTVDGPAKRAKEAFKNGVTMGRNGKGSIFVWASGNGGKKDDNCNCDGYTNSIYTLSISSTTEHTQKPWYSEDCSSTLATTYSSGISSEKQIVTTDLDKKCTQYHTGTSASAPLAAGICALALEANPKLTWRDMQHIVVRTANPEGLKADDWAVNAVGRKVSHSYGYGLMDAYAMVTMAKRWRTVPQQRKCNITVFKSPTASSFSKGNRLRIPFTVSSCEGVMPDRLEHVQAEISADCNKRGGMYIYLTSAMGTKSTLLDQRALDMKKAGFSKWPFMTTHNWDENPRGDWVLEISTDGTVGGVGTLSYFNLVLYGTLDSDWPAGLVNNGTTSTKAATTETTSFTTMRKTTIPPSKETTTTEQNTTPNNCKMTTDFGKSCLVCEDGYVRSPDKLYCLKSCPPGHYTAMERVEESVNDGVKTTEKIPRAGATSDEDKWESQQDAFFEEEERFDGARICVPCSAGPYCTACDGPRVSDCSKCMDSFKLVTGQCTLDPSGSSEMHQKIYGLTVAVCILSIIIFIFLFVFLHCCRSQNKHCFSLSSVKPLYTYVPNGRDNEELDGDRYFRNGSVGLVENGSRYKNGSARKHAQQEMDQGLLDDSDEDRT